MLSILIHQRNANLDVESPSQPSPKGRAVIKKKRRSERWPRTYEHLLLFQRRDLTLVSSTDISVKFQFWDDLINSGLCGHLHTCCPCCHVQCARILTLNRTVSGFHMVSFFAIAVLLALITLHSLITKHLGSG